MSARDAFSAILRVKLKLRDPAVVDALLAIYDETHAAIAEKDARLAEARQLLAAAEWMAVQTGGYHVCGWCWRDEPPLMADVSRPDEHHDSDCAWLAWRKAAT
jgi:hypothetical protein